MKKLQQVKDEHAIKLGYKDWDELLFGCSVLTINSNWNAVAKEYAVEVLKEAAYKAKTKFRKDIFIEKTPTMFDIEIDKDSILNIIKEL